MKLEKEKIKNLKVGDSVVWEDGDVGMVEKVGFTFLHNHKFVKIRWLEFIDDCGYSYEVTRTTLKHINLEKELMKVIVSEKSKK